MKSVLPVLVLLLALLITPATLASKPWISKTLTDKPQRIVSLSLCTDQLLLMLVDKKRIAALSYLAADPLYSYMWQASEGVTLHHNLAEEIIPVNPDLIIAATFTRGNSRQMLQNLGHTVLTFAAPQTIAEVEQLTRAVGNAVNEPERAETIIRTMHNSIEQAKHLVADKPKQLALSYGPNGYTAGKYTMKNTILQAVGLRNLAAEIGIDHYGTISLEQLVLSNPDIIIIDDDISNQNSLAQRSVNHPVLKRLLTGKKQASLPISYWICPGPIAGKAILELAEQR